MSAAGGRSSEAAVRSGSDGKAKRLRKVQAPVTCERPQRFAADGATVRSRWRNGSQQFRGDRGGGVVVVVGVVVVFFGVVASKPRRGQEVE